MKKLNILNLIKVKILRNMMNYFKKINYKQMTNIRTFKRVITAFMQKKIYPI